MNLQGTQRIVLARIPDLNAGTGDEDGEGLPTSAGRWISQSLSFKVLVGAAVFLLFVAVVPFVLGKKAKTPEVATDATAWHTDAPQATQGAPSPAAPSRPVAMIPATAERTTAPAVIPASPEKKVAKQPAKTPDSPLMSAWPNPMGSASGSQASDGRRSTNYEADARAGGRSQDSNGRVK